MGFEVECETGQALLFKETSGGLAIDSRKTTALVPMPFQGNTSLKRARRGVPTARRREPWLDRVGPEEHRRLVFFRT